MMCLIYVYSSTYSIIETRGGENMVRKYGAVQVSLTNHNLPSPCRIDANDAPLESSCRGDVNTLFKCYKQTRRSKDMNNQKVE